METMTIEHETGELDIGLSTFLGRTIIDLMGEVDLFTRDLFKDVLLECISKNDKGIVINLDGLDFMDSTGIAVLILAYKEARLRQADFKLICNKDPLKRILSVTGLDRVFDIHGDVLEAAVCRGGNQYGCVAF